MRHQRSVRPVDMAGQTGVPSDVAGVLRNGRQRRGGMYECPQKPHEHQSTEREENRPENPPAGSFARHTTGAAHLSYEER
jgi:hypothetical protein